MNNQKSYSTETPLINLVDLLWSILLHWKSVVVIALIFAALGGLYKGITEYKKYLDKEYVSSQEAAYQNAMDYYTYEKQRLESRVSIIKDEIIRQDEYAEKSILLNTDPYETYSSVLVYYVDSHYEIMPEYFYQNPDVTNALIRGYRTLILNANIDELLYKNGMEMTSVNPISSSTKSVISAVTDNDNGLLTIRITIDTEDHLHILIKEIEDLMSQGYHDLSESIGEHTLYQISKSEDVSIDVELLNLQESYRTNYASLMNSLNENNKKLSSLTKPTDSTPSLAKVGMSTVKFAVIGGVIGIVLSFAFWLLYYLLGDKLLSPQDITHRYQQTCLSAVPSSRNRRSKLDLLFYKQLHIDGKITEQSGCLLTAAKINLLFPEIQNICLISSSLNEQLTEICSALQEHLPEKEIIVGGNISKDPEAIHILREVGLVLCVEQWQIANHPEIAQQLDLLSAAHKESVAFMIIC